MVNELQEDLRNKRPISAEKKGVLCYPDLENLFGISEEENPMGGKKGLYKKLVDTYFSSWNNVNEYITFKNKSKVYGSVQLDAVLLENECLDNIKDYIKHVFDIIMLARESLLDFADNLKTVTGSGYVVTLGVNNLVKLSDADIALFTNKGWTVA